MRSSDSEEEPLQASRGGGGHECQGHKVQGAVEGQKGGEPRSRGGKEQRQARLFPSRVGKSHRRHGGRLHSGPHSAALWLGTRSFTLLPRLECSGVISAHYNHCLLGSRDSPASASQTGFHHVGQAGLELPTSGDLPTLASKCLDYRESHYVTQAGVQWYSLSSPQPPPPGFKHSPALSSQVAGITGACHCAQRIFVFLVEMGFCHVDQTGLELLTSGDPPALASRSARIIGVNHHAWPCTYLFTQNNWVEHLFEELIKVIHLSDFIEPHAMPDTGLNIEDMEKRTDP
ncbi:hypothetical protein AAY473_026644 [Plecturocebus cupreus]